ncbi:MAG: Ig-like domain-containing protein [Patescibacteria group bacterium]
MYSLKLTPLSLLRTAAVFGLVAIASLAFFSQAHAADTINSAVYQDANGDGTVDRIRWTMDENVTACTYEAGDWTVNTASQMTVVITGLTCATNDAFLYINITTDANETGAATSPVVSYANAVTAGSVTLTSGNMAAHASITADDGAAPVLVSTSPTSAATGVATSASVVLTFSEAMATTFVEGTEFTISPDPGAFSAAWTVSDSVVTLSMTDLHCSLAYTITTVEAEVLASAGTPDALITTGPQDGDWTFTASPCGSSTGSSSPAVISSFTYAGPVCSATNTHSFSITGSNIDAHLVSGDMYFADATWESNNIEGSATIEAAFAANATTAYLALKSDSGAVSNTHSFSLSSWASACASSTDDETPTDDSETDDNDSSEDEIVPVAGVSPGDVIHSSSSTAVYYVTPTYGRRVFINEATYFTWFHSFDVVKEVSTSTLAALPLEGNMLPKAGVVLVKIQSSPVVYFLDDSNTYLVPALREIRDEATAITLFGSAWADYVIDVEPTFFMKFEAGLDVEVGEDLDIDIGTMKKRVNLHE